MTSLLCPALRRALRLVAVKSGEQLLVGSSKSAQQGRSSFSLNGARKGWQLCHCMTASDGRGKCSSMPAQDIPGRNTGTVSIAHAGRAELGASTDRPYCSSKHSSRHMRILNNIVAPVVLRPKSSHPS